MNEEKIKEKIELGRAMLKYDTSVGEYETDQMKKLPQPPLFKEKCSNETIALNKEFDQLKINQSFNEILLHRKSNRVYSEQDISLDELAYLLYMSQGVKEIKGNYATFRPVACGGARHEFETYLIVNHVQGLKKGKYHYLAQTHELEYLGEVDNMFETIDISLAHQTWATKSSVVFYWSILPYRCEWRYSFDAYRAALMDVGHVGQNLYLSATALHLGVCTLASFDLAFCNQCFDLDGEEEFILYTATIGTIAK